LTGHLPFQDEEPMALLAAHLNRVPPPVSSIARRPIPRELDRIVERCMAKDPADRFPSTQALLDALQHVDGSQRYSPESPLPG
jgi:serine/threonine protein kinase